MSALTGTERRRLAPASTLKYAALMAILVPRNLAILVIIAYRKLVSPLYGDVCRYHPSCSHYGLGIIQYRGVIVGVPLTVWRILRCNPWSSGGFDYPRPFRGFRYHITTFGLVVPRAGRERGTRWTF